MKVTALIVAAALALGACSSASKTDTASMGMVNTTCPYSGQPASADHTAEYNGQEVGFCCNGCAGKFSKLDDAGKSAMVSKAK